MSRRGLILSLALLAMAVAAHRWPRAADDPARGLAREAVAPAQRTGTSVLGRLGRIWDDLRRMGELPAENQALFEELTRLRMRVADLEALEDENLALRGRLGFVRRSAHRLIAAEVIGREPSGWWQAIRLAKGSADGVAPGQAVVTPEGLVGRVVRTTPRTADVLLISDPSSRVAVTIERTATFGLLEGTGPSDRSEALCRMTLMDKLAPVREGDVVLTSGLGGVFPKGLRVGRVVSVEVDRGGLHQSAQVLSLADVASLHYVFVVQRLAEDMASEDLGPAEAEGAP